MLEILNRYSHGLASVPFLHALRQRGGLARLESGAQSAEELANALSANRAYLDVALRILVCLEWLRRSADGRYEATPELANAHVIPAGIMDLYRFPFDAYVGGDTKESLDPWLEQSERRWNSDHPFLPDFLDGVLTIPLLLALQRQKRVEVVERKRDGRDVAALRLRVEPHVRRAVERLFVARGWAGRTGRTLYLNRAGRFIVDRIFITATVASYTSMFRRADELLFGDEARVFARDAAGHETHVDRTVNVIGSGFQHEKYFAALSDMVVRCFDGDDYAKQPKYIVDMGCGDGTLLRRLYEAVRNRTRRGKVLDAHPLIPIAADFNEEALAEASRTLAGIEHIAVRGDIGDPAALLETLRANGAGDLHRVLHVRSFLDHNRPWRAPEDRDAAARRTATGGNVYIDADGKAIAPGEMIQSTVEHLRRWAQVVNEHGLGILEVHCLPPDVTARYRDESENFHFDLYHALSHQYLLDAPTFLACAAEAGLFCAEGRIVGFPKNLPFTRITLSHFERRPYLVRHMNDEFVLEAEGRTLASVRCERGETIRVASPYAQTPKDLDDLLQFVEQYWALAGFARVAGIDECRAAVSSANDAPSLARAVAREVRALVAHYPFAVADDPRAAERELGKFSFRWLLAHLQRMGVMREAGEAYGLEALKRQLGVAPKYYRYFDALMRRLADEGLVSVRNGRVETTALVRGYALTAVDEQVAEFKRSFAQRYAASAGLMNFTASCLSRYEEVLTGRVDITDVLFESGDMTVFAELFRGDVVSDYFNRIVADAVRQAVLRLGATRPKVRILEIGAGTGGTTAGIVEALDPLAGSVELSFTDISRSFLRYAKRRFGKYPWIEYRTLNIEDDLAQQGYEAQRYDIIVAANVLHDTRDIEHTLAQTRALLEPGGVLLVNEYTLAKDCLSFSGALLHGYWLFQDPERRLRDSCLMSVPQWQVALGRSGFATLEAFVLPTQSASAECTQSVMLCEAVAISAPEPLPARVPGSRKSEIVGALVEQQALMLLGEERASAYSARRPLMDMGLDSMELVELKSLMERHLAVKLTPNFLFEHETPERLAAALSEMVADEQLPSTDNHPPAVETVELAAVPVHQAAVPVHEKDQQDAIAIVGMACRFPGGAASPASFWKLLESGRDGIASLPEGRWRWPSFVDAAGAHRGIDKAGFLERIDEFDAPFFRISAKEAELMDPQQRLMLELSWEAMEDGGHRPSELSGQKIGVFVGVCHSDYREVVTAALDSAESYLGTGSAHSLLANRLSFFYDFKGPSLTVDTACSSSLVALHDAVTAIRRGDCAQALVGAVNLLCSPTNSVSYYRAGMLSPTGTCRTFDEAADGYVRGEGGAVLLVKPLAMALADGDAIYGLVKGTAVNHGGQAASLTAPKPDAQAAVIEAAWQAADVPLASVGYIEAHGTGTKLGDPIEVGGLIEAFRRLYRSRGEAWPQKPHCGLGSVKTNIGHLESAAGLAGLIKILMAIQNRSIPATLHFERLNPNIELDGSPFYIATRQQAWPACLAGSRSALPRRAGVSSFGFGGSNAHAVVEEFALPASGDAGNGEHLIPLSAKNGDRLREQARRLLGFLESDLESRNPVSLADVAYTLQIGREEMEERLVFVVEDKEELITVLDAYIGGNTSIRGCYHGRVATNGKRKEQSVPGRDPGELASQWVNGADVDWARLHDGRMRRRVHLPVYAFARERHWVAIEQRPVAAVAAASLHPILHQNASGLPSTDPDREETSPRIAEQESIAGDHHLVEQLQSALMPIVLTLLKVGGDGATPASDLGSLGFDSIAYVHFAEEVNRKWDLGVEPMVFFEHRTTRAFAGHLANTYGEKLSKHFASPLPEKKVVEKPRRTRFTVAAEAPSRIGTAEPIAIVGMSGRFPMASDVDELWRNLLEGRDSISEIPAERWHWREVHGQTGQKIQWGGFIEGVDEFDPAFFNISPREAALMDPQQRLLLMYAWKAIEDAGYAASQLSGSNTAIFFGTGMTDDYGRLVARSCAGFDPYLSTGAVASVGPNRASYYLNLHGPSNPVETACSSSLVAIHRAVSAMKSGECDMAIVGGVNTILTPDLHVSLSKAGFLSPDGRCKTFSDRADGYVRSEGVAALFLKRLSAAEEAGDHIYGLIVGSAENHGGRANTLTSPNPVAQAELLERAYTEAGVDPRAVTYVEAHGTGTALGDPIEIEGLKSAFSRLHQTRGVDVRPGLCGLGAVKSNVGHLEVAAGVTGVIKVLLQMKHRQLVPTLHCDTINPHIQLDGSPFYVVRKTTEWTPARDDRGGELPRIAGVSSFGFGGANAHVVLQEYVPPARVLQPQASRHAVVLSARNRERLREQVEQFLAAIRSGRFADADLNDVAYTLQVGREAMDERLGLMVSSLAELEDKLQAFLGGEARPGLYSARASKGEELLTGLASDDAFQLAIDKWIEQGRVEKLAELWVNGVAVDWHRAYRGAQPQRVSLPTYPFARTRCWVEPAPALPEDKRIEAAVLHPLLHRNTSDLNEQRFSSSFSGTEFFLKEGALPGAPLLEMARAAIEQAIPDRPEGTVLELQSVSWEQPFVAAADKQVHIALYADDDGGIEYEIYSEDGEQDVVHCEGRAVWSREAAPARLDHDRLLWLTAPQEQKAQGYVLHPSHMDEALQACASLEGFGRTRSPFAVQSLRIFAPCTQNMSAWVRYAKGSNAADAIVRTDIDLCDEHGTVCAQLRGVAWRQAAVLTLATPAPAIAAPFERKKLAPIALATPAAAAAHTAARNRTPITLSVPKLQEVSPDGVLVIDVAAFEPENAALRLRQTLADAQRDPSVNVVVLAGLERFLASTGRDAWNRALEQKLFECIVTFPHPVIAALQGDTSGAAFLVAALCDVMVCNESASYWYTDPDADFYPTSAETSLFNERFGRLLAQDFLYASSRSTGRQLRDKGWTCPIVPGADVVSHARKLAATMARHPRRSMGIVKEHLIRHVAQRVRDLTPVAATEAAGGSHSDEIVIASPAAHIRVDRASDDVLIVTLGHAEPDVLARELGEVLDAIRYACSAIVLASDDRGFLPANMPQDVVTEFERLLIDCSVPVVGVLAGDVRGHAWLTGQFCDACVYSATGVYSLAGIAENRALAESASVMFMHRLGDHAGCEIVLTGGEYSGVDLRERVGTLVAVERDQVPFAAVALARSFARLPRTTTSSWKRETAALLREKQRRLAAMPWDDSSDASPEPFAEPRSIALRSNVVTLTEHPGGIVVVKLEDREAKNMFSDAFRSGIREAFAHIRQAGDYKVVVLTGYDTYFSSGGSKEGLLDIQSGKIRFTDDPVFDLPLHCELPVIAAMQGHGIGAGWTLGLISDTVLHSEESRHFNPYLQYGFAPADGSTLVFPEKFGMDLATESFLTAERYTGRELKQRGLQLPVLPRSEVIPAAMALARRMAQMSRGQLIALKRRLTLPLRERLEETYRLELILHDKTIKGNAEALARIQKEFFEGGATQVHSEPAPQPLQATRPDALAEVTATLRKLLAAELQMPESDVDDDALFVDLGLDSIIGVTWIRKINDAYQTSLEAARVYSHPTLTQLSRYVTERLNQRGTLPAPEVQRNPAPQPLQPVATDALSTVTATLRQLLANELQMPESDIDEDALFVDLGLDSIVGVTWIRKINETYQTSLEAARVYSHPTLAQLSRHVAEKARIGSAPVTPSLSVSAYRKTEAQPPAPRVPVVSARSSRRRTRARSAAPAPAAPSAQPIAIIGMAGQFPKANNLDAFWRNIAAGRDCVTEVPRHRWDVNTWYQPDGVVPGKTNCRWFGSLDDYDVFDPLFFNISPSEAEFMDPQQRLFMQETWRAIENAGYDPRRLSGSRCGVFAGSAMNDYQLQSRELQLSAQGWTGDAPSILPARISYLLNLHGPCLSIDTACSAALVAIVQACDSLASGGSDLALAGGVWVIAGPEMFIKAGQAGMLSPHGKCFTFDERADGFVPGEGVGVVLLKRLADAERDRDIIHAVIQGWGVNQDGKTNGITAPNPESQTRLEQEVYDKHRIDPSDIQLVEAHGTGTKLGDPIEVEGLKQAFHKYTRKKNYCAIGSVKSNIGHCGNAAGVAGLLKAVLAVQHKQLPPTIHFARLNEHIDLQDSPFYVNTRLQDWALEGTDRRLAAVSSFGFGGTNAHVVVGEYPEPAAEMPITAVPRETPVVIPLSAKTAEQLLQKERDLLEFIRNEGALDLIRMAYTLQTGREAMEMRAAFVVSSTEQLAQKLAAHIDGDAHVDGVRQGRAVRARRNELAADTDPVTLAERWTTGSEIDWDALYGEPKPRRIVLPAYPFARERYWIQAPAGERAAGERTTAVLHPLLHSNTSDLTEQRYSSTFTGDEFFLADHLLRIDGETQQKVVPGVALLEMVRVAVEQASPAESSEHVLELRDTVWLHPIIVAESRRVAVALSPADGDQLEYQVYSTNGDERIVHAEGRALWTARPAAGKLDLGQLEARMALGAIAPDDLYPRMQRLGIIHGPSFQLATVVHRGSDETLTRLRLPAALEPSSGEYILHPSMMDAALHGSQPLIGGWSESPKPKIPFALESLRVLSPCKREMVSWSRYSPGTQPESDLVKLDVELCDLDGNVCVQMRGFTPREINRERDAAAAAPVRMSIPSGEVHSGVQADGLVEKTVDFLRRQFAGLFKMPSQKIDPQVPLATYGMDSVMSIKLTYELVRTFGTLSKTLFFEYQTVHDLAGYFVANHTPQLQEMFGGGPAAVVPVRTEPPARPVEKRRFRAAVTKTADDSIAIIGLSGRYPQANTIEEFWRNLRDGRDSITEIPAHRFDWRELFTEDRRKAGRLYTKWGGFIEGADEFDPLFFSMSPVEAQQTDPQERLFLQHAWMAVEDAGYTRASLQVPCDNDLPGQVGVYAGVWCNEYQLCGANVSERGEGRGIAVSIGTVANRVSYALNLHGPSYTVDTMCSASLTAIHLACMDLKLGRTTMAIAGGVNLSLHPNKYLALSDVQALSIEGRCQAFGDGGDGFIPSEGVGVVVLKRLSDAERDGDHIYGLIRGSALNHGGRTSGFTVPNPQAQATLISRALTESGTDPRHISYLEAHGTGTKLGDPIEITALNKAFQQSTRDTQFCAIGSVKSNIGHGESAAGVAGLTKILLQMQHQEIVPSLHTEQLNPFIDFENSPFVVSRSLQRWSQPVIDGRMLPRVAGLSSFGAGGANAHLIIEEYQGAARPAMTFTDVVIVLSARTAVQLQQKVRDLLQYVRERLNTLDLAATAYTLQVGREAMDERLAFIVSSAAQLADKLEAHLAGGVEVEESYSGQVKRNGEALSVFNTDPDLQQTVDKWLAGRKYSKILELWVKGLEIDWTKLYGDVKPPRVSLPVYPFARERYWIEGRPRSASDGASAAILHPLLHRNTSILTEQRYSSLFTGQEFFLTDHQLRTNGSGGKKVLPGVAYLEMARAAIAQALPEQPQSSALELHNTVWLQPVVVSDEKEIHITLAPNGGEHIDYEVYSEDAGERVVHCQGRASWGPPAVERIDLAQLERDMPLMAVEPQSVYASWARIGVIHGASLQGMTAIRQGNGQALVCLRLPGGVVHTAGDYVLHPSLMDSALQAAVGLITGWADASAGLLLPFTLDALRVAAPCTTEMFAWVRQAPGSVAGSAVIRLDVDLCDSDGRVCVGMSGFTVRALETADPEPGMPLITIAPVWEAVPVEWQELSPRSGRRVVVIGGNAEQHRALRQRCGDVEVLQSVESIAGSARIDHVIWIAPDAKRDHAPDRAIEAQSDGVLLGFRLIKALLEDDYGTSDLQWTVITNATQKVRAGDTLDPTHASVHGLIGSMAKEYANWKVRAVDVGSVPGEADGADEWPWNEILRLPWDARGDGWAYREGQWYRRRIVECDLAESTESGYRRRGVYVVVGGAGGVGEALTEYLIRAHDARVVWIGRREQDAEIEEKLRRVSAAGGERPLYIAADARRREDLERAYRQIQERHGCINGIIHSTIILADRGLANMSEEQFRASLSAKVDVAVRMAQVFGREPLDFILYFSSVQSFLKLPGQSNYAAGCTFADAFAEWQSANADYAVKVMNWGYWGSVGVVAGTDYQERMARAGVGSIEPEDGMAGLERLLRAPLDQAGMIRTDGAETARNFGISIGEALWSVPQEVPSVCERITSDIVHDDSVREQMSHWEAQHDELDDLLAKMLWLLMRSMAWTADQPAHWTFDEWKKRAGAIGDYDRWIAQSLRILGDRGYLDETTHAGEAALWQEWETAMGRWAGDPGMRGQLALVDATLRNLPEILRGQKRATDVVFPNSSLDLVEGVYRNSWLMSHCNRVMAEVAGRYAETRPGGALRLLELGAGTGSSSEVILRKLDPHRQSIEEYCYSDISKVFLLHGEEAYGEGRDYLKYAIVDAEKGLAEQGLECGAYDMVLATNCLHATRRLRETVRNAKAALKKNGLLVLNEFVKTSVSSHATFGLLDGWWLYEDEGLRMNGSPGLTAEAWKRVLEEEGFRKVVMAVPGGDRAGQQVIVAESDGIIRQRRAAKARPAASVAVTVPVAPPPPPVVAPVVAVASETVEAPRLLEMLQEGLVDAICTLLKVRRDDIDLDAELSEFGFDSISLTRFANQLNDTYDLDLTPAIFYEHTTVRSLARHLADAYGERLAARFEIPKSAPVVSLAREESGPLQIRSRAGLDRPAPTGAVVSSPASRQPSAVNRVRSEEPRQEQSAIEPIAIVGMSGRFPGADDLHGFWDNLRAGKESIGEIPRERWDWRAYYGDEKEGGNTSSVKWGAFIDGVDEFDPLFFGISPREAVQMDPAQRLLMMYGWKAFEDAGYAPQRLWGSRTGIFVGTTMTGYGDLLLTQARAAIEGYSASGLAASVGPARLSYFLNLRGPSEPIETACSSSLVAVHRAVRSIRDGECDMALAGGVSLLLSPMLHVSFSKAGMLSRDGKCKTFSSSADGYVRGEGVGMLVLKRLSAAERDGDHIYGLIRGSAENHGGRAQSLTSPNPQAQAEVIKEAYSRAGVSPATVSYIEAHGTGTELGDPVEINGLKSAFQSLHEELGEAPRSGYCGLGSVKTNIGHTELAAGVAGVIKVLLQMKHGTLVPSLHCDEVNPYIRLDESPFYVVREQRPWNRVNDQPLRAGVSSFGFGGVNAHVLLEEYVDGRRDGSAPRPALIVLSARDEARLSEQVLLLRQAVARQAFTDDDLDRIAYTLQAGRDAMEYRFATAVRSLAELEAKLQAFLDGSSGIDALWTGRAQRNGDALEIFRGDEDLRELVDKWIERGRWSKLLDLWVRGVDIDWAQLYGAEKPRRISLPAYSFAKERYWVDTPAGGVVAAAPAAVSVLHPLLHQNTSDLRQQRFSSTFTGEEFFLTDHRVRTNGHGGQKVLPAVAYLEMAREAIEQALPERPESGVLELRDMVWVKPLFVAKPTQVAIALTDAEDGRVEYEIFSVDGGQETMYCQGHAVFEPSAQIPRLRPDELRAQMNEGKIEPSELYALMERLGFDYGPAHRGVTAIHLGERQLLAELRLPVLIEANRDEYALHPSVMDSALQAAVGLIVDPDRTPDGPILPFALRSVRIASGCQKEMFAWVRYASGSKRGDRSVELDIDLCAPDGTVCVQMRGFASRVLERHAASAVRLPIKKQEPAFDDAYYEKVLADIAEGTISVDDAIELS